MQTVTLKLNGKSFTCTGKAGSKRCKSKNFFVQPDLELPNVPDVPAYACVICGTERFGGLNSGLEENVPMRNDWCTPGGSAFTMETRGLWSTLHREYGFTIDVAADATNAKCPIYLGPENGSDPLVVVPPNQNGLLLDWCAAFAARVNDAIAAEEVRAWWNPPYNPKGAVEAWLQKAIQQATLGVFSVGLIPMATSVAWFNELVIPFAEWHSFYGRIAFEDPEPGAQRVSPKQDNLLVIFDPNSDTIGHSAVRDAKTGEKLWVRP